ncbi:hypothetical protein D3C78_514400 [compost metagenome]
MSLEVVTIISSLTCRVELKPGLKLCSTKPRSAWTGPPCSTGCFISAVAGGLSLSLVSMASRDMSTGMLTTSPMAPSLLCSHR